LTKPPDPQQHGARLRATAIALAQTAHIARSAAAGVVSNTVKGIEMATSAPQTGYVPVNGLNMYYEIHGAG
jgi:hypothetical protein